MLGHGYAVKSIGSCHCAAAVRDHDELRAVGIALDVLCQTLNVHFVECCLNFVQNTERCGVYLNGCKEQCNTDKCLFTTGKLHQILDDFAGRCGFDLNTALEYVFGIGQRQLGRTAAEELGKHLTEVLENAVKAGYVHFISGLALGIDMIAADIVLSLKKKHKNVTLTGAVPCPGQEEPWRDVDQKRYRDLIKKCDQVVICSDSYKGSETMHIRNHFMVDNSAVVVAIWNGKPSGTGSTVKYAKEHGCKVKIINPEDFR